MAEQIKFQGKELDANTLRAISSNVLVEGARPILWWRKQANDLHTKFMREMRTSLENGESAAKAATRVTGGTIAGVQVPGIIQTSKNNAKTLSRTALNKVTNEARVRSFEENDDVVKAMKQISTLDNRTSQICIAYDGQVWENAKGNKPIPPSTLPFNGGPPRHFNCRSTLVPVLKSWEELDIPADELSSSTRASMDGQVPEDTTFDAFLKSKGKAFQDDILGPTKAKLWRSGKITLAQLVDFRGNPLPADQLLAVAEAKRAPKKRPATDEQKTIAASTRAGEAVASAEEVVSDARKEVTAAAKKAKSRAQKASAKAANTSLASADESLAAARALIKVALKDADFDRARAKTAAARRLSTAAKLSAGAAVAAAASVEQE